LYTLLISSMHATYLAHPIWICIILMIWRVQITELCTVQFFPSSCHFTPLRSKYSSKHPVVKTPSICVLPLVWQNTFHTHTIKKVKL
jgi:hypothetical protein